MLHSCQCVFDRRFWVTTHSEENRATLSLNAHHDADNGPLACIRLVDDFLDIPVFDRRAVREPDSVFDRTSDFRQQRLQVC
jgi:hypothetical protein